MQKDVELEQIVPKMELDSQTEVKGTTGFTYGFVAQLFILWHPFTQKLLKVGKW